MIVTLDGQIHTPGTPLLHADDLAAVRGDGVFETLLVRDGRACLVEPHLQRLTQSAQLMDLPEPDLPRWRHAIDVAAQRWTATTADEGALRLIYSRGRETGSAPTTYVMVNPLPSRVASVRRDGLAAVTLDRGLPATGAGATPWLLASAKTLSYAVNMAALRHAARQDAGDVIFVSSDGYILEGPRSTVVIATNSEGGTDDNLCLLTPPPWYPILRGTTQQALFEVARAKGYDCDYRALRIADLHGAQGIWLISSMTLAARVHTLDGRRLLRSPMAAAFVELVDAAIVSDR
ncbi:aminodeoxychorismate lyase [Mycobacterium haemophilum]|uniref:aminodeoxychorismate lyase n=1 Tax=Mycobacterium haemophilum TaxID=29311 RepID=A0A0I9TJA8_9MYCO|nr:aminodeoxychorismate lyase [Mycobacterium haemophilum]AKN18487.1 4-amino-4-deoxychorismate lyase [Mycobacterium haemophilum DSM 44634]KLO29944.1 4-amino-4-deoxychorismate lyase [Mycobacterium haemophilum]KLO38689.1 4-amino-4-deoxychorismate lyase [Mycobacterium haemophilum]KLO45006.1 4-amino-4-deoxychorismate lyase [Mycobacterium haemophilum]KLO56350.1 4-amino-4-deoxychorismate lyase [Mycobacterium haemophilum]